ncbi:hypothetical protein GCM10009550_07980 [Actinocorallia libanotica]|uniref:Uncharacterized protein n=1 Tax=Actinocorallia libanotica TaxID=46162 RepID=A0ABN1Q9B7_9ACTN
MFFPAATGTPSTYRVPPPGADFTLTVTDEEVITAPFAGEICGCGAARPACATPPTPITATSGATATSALNHTRKIPSAHPVPQCLRQRI